jgi:hypothetical protein
MSVGTNRGSGPVHTLERTSGKAEQPTPTPDIFVTGGSASWLPCCQVLVPLPRPAPGPELSHDLVSSNKRRTCLICPCERDVQQKAYCCMSGEAVERRGCHRLLSAAGVAPCFLAFSSYCRTIKTDACVSGRCAAQCSATSRHLIN